MSFPINLIYLKYFCDAVKFGGITASANKNFVTQSAISQAVTKLERSLGKKLINHGPNRFKLTYEGKIVYEKSKDIFLAISTLSHALEESSQGVHGQVEFACTHSFALALLPTFLKLFAKSYPHVKVNFHLAHADSIKIWLRKGIIDCGIVLDNEDFSAFHQRPLYHGLYKLYSAKTVKDPHHLPFLLSEEQRETRQLKESYHKALKKEIEVLMEVSSWEVIANLTEEGIGIGFFPDYIALKKSRLKQLDLKLPPIPYKLLAITNKTQKLERATEAFLETLEAQLKKQLKPMFQNQGDVILEHGLKRN